VWIVAIGRAGAGVFGITDIVVVVGAADEQRERMKQHQGKKT